MSVKNSKKNCQSKDYVPAAPIYLRSSLLCDSHIYLVYNGTEHLKDSLFWELIEKLDYCPGEEDKFEANLQNTFNQDKGLFVDFMRTYYSKINTLIKIFHSSSVFVERDLPYNIHKYETPEDDPKIKCVFGYVVGMGHQHYKTVVQAKKIYAYCDTFHKILCGYHP